VLLCYCYNSLLLHNFLASLQVQQIGFLSHWDPYNVLSLEVVALRLYRNMVEWSQWY